MVPLMGDRGATIILLLILSIILVSLPDIGIVKAQDIIYIRSDGSVEGTDKIQRNGDIYTFTGNISLVIQIQRSNIVVEGVGYTLQGDGEMHGTDIHGRGLEIVGCKNVTIRNLNIKEFTRGIRFTNSFDCNIYQNSLTNNSIGIEMGYVDESYSNNNTVSGNIIKENGAGIRLIYGSSNTIFGNTITANDEGVSVWGTSGNIIIWNNITNNNRGIYIETSGINIIHHNNFIDNINDWWDYGLTPWPFQLPFSVNIWDDGIEGNYWSNYDGTDSNGDGVGDTPHNLYENNTDNYPLVAPIYLFDAGTWEWTQYNVDIISNSTVSDFSFNPEGALIQFNVEGEDGTTGFCRVTIPKDLLYAEGNWVVFVDGNSVTPRVNEDLNSTYLYFTYDYTTKTIEIRGTDAIPEFPSWTPTLLILIVLAVTLAIYKRRLPKKLKTQNCPLLF